MFQKHDPVSRPWYRLHELFHGALLHETVLELQSNTKWQDSPQHLNYSETSGIPETMEDGTRFCVFFCFFYIMKQVHTVWLLKGFLDFWKFTEIISQFLSVGELFL